MPENRTSTHDVHPLVVAQDTRLPTSNTQRDRSLGDRRLWLAGISLAALFALLIGLYWGGSAYETPAEGLPDPGPLVGWGLPVAKLLSVALGALTIGLLLAAAFLLPSPGRGVVSKSGRRDLLLASASAAGWSISSLFVLFFTHATVMGQPLLQALEPQTFLTFAFEVPQNVAFLLTAILAAIIAVSALVSATTGAAALLTGVAFIALILPPINAHGSGSGDHSLAMTSGALHAAAAAAWIGGLVVLTLHVFRKDAGAGVAIRRFSVVATVALAALAATGLANTYTRLERPEDLWSTAYGVMVIGKVVLLVALALIAYQSRKQLSVGVAAGERGPRLRWLTLEGLFMALTLGLALSMTLTPYPRVDVPFNTAAEELLGFAMPPEPTAANVLFGWYPDPFWLFFCALLLVAYVGAVVRLRRNGVAWPLGRLLSWSAGVAVLFWSTNAGIAGYGAVSVGWHMVQHMTLAMLAPILLVLGMPMTLALRALRPSRGRERGPREWLLWALHSGVSKLVTHPIYVLVIGTFGLFGLYFTPLFSIAMTSHAGHILMMLHFLISGFLFYWVVLGLDPGPRTVPPWARLILLLVYISLHAFFALAIMSLTEPLAEEWYALVQPPWLPDLVADTTTSGGIAWGFGEIPTLIVMIVVAVQWARSDTREAKRIDRQADRDGDAALQEYNNYLASLAGQKTAGGAHPADPADPPKHQPPLSGS